MCPLALEGVAKSRLDGVKGGRRLSATPSLGGEPEVENMGGQVDPD